MRRIALTAGVTAAAGLMALGLALPASAGSNPDPHPTPTKTETVPPPVPVPQTCSTRPITFTPTVSPSDQASISTDAKILRRGGSPPPTVNPQQCRPETFVSQITAVGSSSNVVRNFVAATGPVAGTGSLDLPAQTDTFDRLLLPAFFRAVNVPHDGLAFPNINLSLCTASVVQVGRWRFAGGTGLFRRAIGNGTYQLVGQWVFPRTRGGLCSLLFLRGNPILQNRVDPVYTSIQVWATGLARR